jgi:hypothetical protein
MSIDPGGDLIERSPRREHRRQAARHEVWDVRVWDHPAAEDDDVRPLT